MTDSGDPIIGLDDEGDSGLGAPRLDPQVSGPWFVRFAGRRTGPFDAERLRTMARRGALGRMHSLSADGKTWVPASSVRAVFTPDGSVAPSSGSSSGTEGLEEPLLGEPEHDGVLELPRSPARRRVGGALVRPVVLAALMLATIMLSMPTSRDDTGALVWWWGEGALGIAVRGLCALAVISGWSVAFLAPEPARAASIAAVASVVSAASALVPVAVSPWVAPLALLVPLSALLVALDAAGSRGTKTAGIAVVIGAGVLSLLAALLGWFHLSGWTIAGIVLGLLGAGALGFAGWRAARGGQGPPDAVFWGGVAGATGAMGSLFAAAFGGLLGDFPMHGALAAVSACLVLSFAALCWASVHEACESSHLMFLTTSGDDEIPA